ncbi:hypothetical protein Scep_011956 [Stephania cephalantha]|uniref:Uncharacterized protein n=1 Tax=Stephania cephalantha TaxID=152367 RepID=A0AAP0P6B7_9MAGN
MDTPQHPLIPASSAAAPPPARRIVFLAAVAILSVWANYEASKEFEIVVVNDVGLDTALGRRLSLLLVSDDSATRAVLRAARLSRRLLYSTDDPVKPVRRIGRSNRAMRDGWDDDRTVDDALGMPARHVRGAYRNLSRCGQVDDGNVASQ